MLITKEAVCADSPHLTLMKYSILRMGGHLQEKELNSARAIFRFELFEQSFVQWKHITNPLFIRLRVDRSKSNQYDWRLSSLGHTISGKTEKYSQVWIETPKLFVDLLGGVNFTHVLKSHVRFVIREPLGVLGVWEAGCADVDDYGNLNLHFLPDDPAMKEF